VLDKNKVFVGQFKGGSQYGYTVLDRNRNIIGYVRDNGAIIENAHKELIGSLKHDGTMEDANHKAIGYFKMQTGAIEDANHNVIAYEVNTEPMWAVPYFLLFKKS
jgi:hypothetical protein